MGEGTLRSLILIRRVNPSNADANPFPNGMEETAAATASAGGIVVAVVVVAVAVVVVT